MKRVLIIANKTWEVEALINVILNTEFKPKELLVPEQLNHPRLYGQIDLIPRATIFYKELLISFEIWCIQDLLDTNKHPASSEEKFKSIPFAINFRNRKQPDFVVAFGTAGFLMPKDSKDDQCEYFETNNGCVVIGSHIFIHDGYPQGDENPNSKLHLKKLFEREIQSNVSSKFFDQLNSSLDFGENIEKRLLKPYLNPSNNIRLIIKQNLIALSNLNITDNNDYIIEDIEGVEAVIKSGTKNDIGSIETTHGIIRILSDSPFIFVSGITDRIGHFNDDVKPRKESQNYSCAFNAGISIAWMLPEIIKFLNSH